MKFNFVYFHINGYTQIYTHIKTEREVNKNPIKQVNLWNPMKSSNVVLLNLLVHLNSSSTRIT